MSSFPTCTPDDRDQRAYRFKALSRMSSFPTKLEEPDNVGHVVFQSAVAHELISNYCLALAKLEEPDNVSKRCRA